MSPSLTLRRAVLLVAAAGALILLVLTLADSAAAAGGGPTGGEADNVDMGLTFNEGRGLYVGDGIPNDAEFQAHGPDMKGVAGLNISLRYSNGTELANLTTNATGVALLYNLTEDTYSYAVHDGNKSFDRGSFVVNDSYFLGSGHKLFVHNPPRRRR